MNEFALKDFLSRREELENARVMWKDGQKGRKWKAHRLADIKVVSWHQKGKKRWITRPLTRGRSLPVTRDSHSSPSPKILFTSSSTYKSISTFNWIFSFLSTFPPQRVLYYFFLFNSSYVSNCMSQKKYEMRLA